MKHRSNLLFIQDIVKAINKIQAYTSAGKQDFLNSEMKQECTFYNFQIIGEAIKHISPKLKETFPEVPWKRMARFRDFLIHNYAGITARQVWRVVEKDLPLLKEQIEKILNYLKERDREQTTVSNSMMNNRLKRNRDLER